MFAVDLVFEGDLRGFLRRRLGDEDPVRVNLREKTSIKDVIESCGVPHTEVDLIVLLDAGDTAARAAGFSWQVGEAARFRVFPVPAPPDVLSAEPRLQDRGCDRFVADGHLAGLARHLRLLGCDVVCERDPEDRRLLEVMLADDRALLTRDRRLLMHAVVRDGYCPRSCDPETQACEVLRRFGLESRLGDFKPLSRCLRCNGRLQGVSKQEVLAPLAEEPRTLRYYDEFFRCEDCGRIYWRGSHFEKLRARLDRLRRNSGAAEITAPSRKPPPSGPGMK